MPANLTIPTWRFQATQYQSNEHRLDHCSNDSSWLNPFVVRQCEFSWCQAHHANAGPPGIFLRHIFENTMVLFLHQPFQVPIKWRASKIIQGMFGYVHNPGYIHLVPEKAGERRLKSAAHVYFAKVEIKHPRKVNTKAKDYGTMETDIFQPYLF